MGVLQSVPQSRRQGMVTTPSARLAANASGEVMVRPDINNTDFRNESMSLLVRIYCLDPVAQVWKQVGGATWQGGGNPNDPDQQPVISVSIDERLRGQEIRAEVEIPTSMRVGCTLETL